MRTTAGCRMRPHPEIFFKSFQFDACAIGTFLKYTDAGGFERKEFAEG
jgi:hypothetical protein